MLGSFVSFVCVVLFVWLDIYSWGIRCGWVHQDKVVSARKASWHGDLVVVIVIVDDLDRVWGGMAPVSRGGGSECMYRHVEYWVLLGTVFFFFFSWCWYPVLSWRDCTGAHHRLVVLHCLVAS